LLPTKYRLTLGPSIRVEDMRASFPLEDRRLDRILRWTRPESMHMTVHTLDAIEEEVDDVADQLEQAIRDAYVLPFSVRTGPVGCFWAAAGSGFGRVPRVVYQVCF
jgi:2'-5' RNA ligase